MQVYKILPKNRPALKNKPDQRGPTRINSTRPRPALTKYFVVTSGKPWESMGNLGFHWTLSTLVVSVGIFSWNVPVAKNLEIHVGIFAQEIKICRRCWPRMLSLDLCKISVKLWREQCVIVATCRNGPIIFPENIKLRWSRIQRNQRFHAQSGGAYRLSHR